MASELRNQVMTQMILRGFAEATREHLSRVKGPLDFV